MRDADAKPPPPILFPPPPPPFLPWAKIIAQASKPRHRIRLNILLPSPTTAALPATLATTLAAPTAAPPACRAGKQVGHQFERLRSFGLLVGLEDAVNFTERFRFEAGHHGAESPVIDEELFDLLIASLID